METLKYIVLNIQADSTSGFCALSAKRILYRYKQGYLTSIGVKWRVLK